MIRFDRKVPVASLGHLFMVLILAVFWSAPALAESSGGMAEKIPMTAEINTFALSGHPYFAAVTHDSKYAYVTDYWTGKLFLVELASGSVNQTIVLGYYGATGLALTPNGSYVYVADYMQHWLSKVDTAANTVSTTIGGMSTPWDVTVHPDGSKVFASDWFGDSVRVVDAATDTLVHTINGLSNPYGVALTPNGNYLYVANNDNNTVAKINTSTNNIDTTINVGGNPMCVAAGPDNNFVYVTNNSSNTVSKINVATDNVDQTINAGSGPFGIDLSPDGKYLFVANRDDNTVSMIDTTTYATEQTFDVGGSPRGCEVSPDGRYVVTANYDGVSITVIDLTPAAAGGGEETPNPGQDPIPPGGPGNELGGGGANGGQPLPPGSTWQPGQGDSNHNLGLVVAHTGEKTGQSGQAVSREFVLPGILFQMTGPAGATEECWVALNESGTMPSGVTYATEVGYNSGAMVAGFNTTWPQSLIQGMSSGTHHLVYYLMTSDGRKSNPRDEYLVVGSETDTASFIFVKSAAVPLAVSELTFKVQLSCFNESTGFVERVSEGMCTVTAESGTWGTFPIADGLLTFTIPFGATSEVGFNSPTFNGPKTVRMEFKDGYMYCFDQDHRDAVVEVYQCVDGESYAMEYYQDLVYICNQGEDLDGPILGRMYGK